MHRRAGRDEAGRFLVEGVLAVRDALRSEALNVEEVFVFDELAEAGDLAMLATERGARVNTVGAAVLRALSETVTPQGAVAVARMPQVDLDEALKGTDLVLVLAEIRDPGNAGTMVRTAEAAGTGCVVFTKGSVDPFGGKTVRAAAGSLLRVPVVRDADPVVALEALERQRFDVIGTAADGDTPVDAVDLAGRVAFVLGNEAWGIPPAIAGRVSRSVTIPMPGPVESLNVAAAASIVLFEAVRQRRARTYPAGP